MVVEGESSEVRSGRLVGDSLQHLPGECTLALVSASERLDIPEALSTAALPLAAVPEHMDWICRNKQ